MKETKLSQLVLRPPRESDLAALLDFVNEVGREEKVMVSVQGRQYGEAEEREWLATRLAQIKKKECVSLLAVQGKRIVGEASVEIDGEIRIKRHVGVFGIMIRKDWRRQGLGKHLAEAVLKTAATQLPNLQIVTLMVYARNLPAQSLYLKLGFKHFGFLPNGVINADDSTEDEILMWRPARAN